MRTSGILLAIFLSLWSAFNNLVVGHRIMFAVVELYVKVMRLVTVQLDQVLRLMRLSNSEQNLVYVLRI